MLLTQDIAQMGHFRAFWCTFSKKNCSGPIPVFFSTSSFTVTESIREILGGFRDNSTQFLPKQQFSNFDHFFHPLPFLFECKWGVKS